MAEGFCNFGVAESPERARSKQFDTEVLMLMRGEIEVAEKRRTARLAKDVKIQPVNVNTPLVTKPAWPYDLWQTNYEDSALEFSQQKRLSVPSSCTSESQVLQMSKQDDGNILDTVMDSCGNKSICEAGTSKKESCSHPEGTTPSESLDNVTEVLQRSINMLTDLQNLLSIGVEKFFKSDSGLNETDSAALTCNETAFDSLGSSAAVRSMCVKSHEDSNHETLVEENCQLPGTDDKNTFLGSDMTSNSYLPVNMSSEYASKGSLPSTSQYEVCKSKGIEKVTEGLNLKSISQSVECEDQLRNSTADTKESSEGDLVPSKSDYEEGTVNNTKMGSEGIRRKSSERSIGTSDCKVSQIRSEDTEQDMAGRGEDESQIEQGKKFNTSKICHFKTELQSPVSAQSVLYSSARKWLSNISIDQSAKTRYIKQLTRSLMENTVLELQTKHQIFSKCYIIEIGSMAEGTKICQPDEFDFNVALPMLANSDVAELFYIEMGIQTRLHDHFCNEVLSFLQQLPFFDGSYRHFLTNAYLLQVFSETMRNHIPEGWVMREESDIHMMRVYLKNQTLTVHIQCNDSGPYPGFVLSMDVCFGIPLDAEQLQTIYVADVHHACSISFIHSESLRMNTGVVAVISRNPLVAERFFYQTEVSRFHDNKPVADCYKLAKHVARTFLPKIYKNNCSLCEDTLIPSFYMKTVVSFMMDFYTERSHWADTQLVNRLIEIFEIMHYSFVHSKFRTLAYYSYIHSMYLDCNMKYIPTNSSIRVGVGMDGDKACRIPLIEDADLPSSHADISTAIQSYWKYMECEEWTVGGLLGKLTDFLYVMKFTETD